jgi:hypothetical protein
LLRAARAPSDNLAAMRFAIGSGFAKCSACQGEDFYPAFPLTADRREVLVCANCDNQTIFSELVGKPGAKLHDPKKRSSLS